MLLLHVHKVPKKEIYGMIASMTFLRKRPNATEINNYWCITEFDNQQNPYRLVGYKGPQNDTCTTIKRLN